MDNRNIRFVNNTGSDIRFLIDAGVFDNAPALPEDYADMFTTRLVSGLNPDGTDRIIIEFAA